MNRKVLRTTPANMVDTSELEEKMKKSETTVFWKDVFSFVLLLLLYMLQGIPMGFGSSIPLILMEHDVSYEALSLFSLVSLPFSLKIIWAPIVDTFYVPSFGRRKTWLVPIQLLTVRVLRVELLCILI